MNSKLLPYRINYHPHTQYLFAQVNGEKDCYEISVAYWTEIFDQCKANGVDRVVVEEDFEVQLDAVDMYKLATGMIEYATAKGIKRIAFIDKNRAHQHLNEFGVTVAVNRGFNIKIFDDRKLAQEWMVY